MRLRYFDNDLKERICQGVVQEGLRLRCRGAGSPYALTIAQSLMIIQLMAAAHVV